MAFSQFSQSCVFTASIFFLPTVTSYLPPPSGAAGAFRAALLKPLASLDSAASSALSARMRSSGSSPPFSTTGMSSMPRSLMALRYGSADLSVRCTHPRVPAITIGRAMPRSVCTVTVRLPLTWTSSLASTSSRSMVLSCWFAFWRSRSSRNTSSASAPELMAKFCTVSVRSGASGAPFRAATSRPVMTSKPRPAPAVRPPTMMVRANMNGDLASCLILMYWSSFIPPRPATLLITRSNSFRSRSRCKSSSLSATMNLRS
mmetsp:Transcript_4135/g.10461  ORF Transcript_4135/g.10461 Transcript_4135/m.10461 type:complete len:260 (+) Transcript_4135:343-1122(+)